MLLLWFEENSTTKKIKVNFKHQDSKRTLVFCEEPREALGEGTAESLVELESEVTAVSFDSSLEVCSRETEYSWSESATDPEELNGGLLLFLRSEENKAKKKIIIRKKKVFKHQVRKILN